MYPGHHRHPVGTAPETVIFNCWVLKGDGSLPIAIPPSRAWTIPSLRKDLVPSRRPPSPTPKPYCIATSPSRTAASFGELSDEEGIAQEKKTNDRRLYDGNSGPLVWDMEW